MLVDVSVYIFIFSVTVLPQHYGTSCHTIFSRGVSRIFERGGSNISWFPKKKSSDFKRGGSNGLKGGVQYICLTRTTNLAYLDAKECTNMYFEPLISVKCCPKLHIKQLRTIYITFVCEIGLGWRGGGSQMKRGGPGKGGGQDPLTPPSGHAYVQCATSVTSFKKLLITYLFCKVFTHIVNY